MGSFYYLFSSYDVQSLDLQFNFLFDRRFWGVFFFQLSGFKILYSGSNTLSIRENFTMLFDGQFQRFWVYPHQNKLP